MTSVSGLTGASAVLAAVPAKLSTGEPATAVVTAGLVMEVPVEVVPADPATGLVVSRPR